MMKSNSDDWQFNSQEKKYLVDCSRKEKKYYVIIVFCMQILHLQSAKWLKAKTHTKERKT